MNQIAELRELGLYYAGNYFVFIDFVREMSK